MKRQKIAEYDPQWQVGNDVTCAKYLGITTRTVEQWRKDLALPHVKLNQRVIRFRRQDVDQWLARRVVATVN